MMITYHTGEYTQLLEQPAMALVLIFFIKSKTDEISPRKSEHVRTFLLDLM